MCLGATIFALLLEILLPFWNMCLGDTSFASLIVFCYLARNFALLLKYVLCSLKACFFVSMVFFLAKMFYSCYNF